MEIDKLKELKKPYYVLYEAKLRRNLELIKSIAERTDVEFILAFKAFALWKTFPIFKEYISSSTASSLQEARLAFEEFGSMAHTYSPAYTDYEIEEISRYSKYLTFNSLSQYLRHKEKAHKANKNISFGLRLNPEYSEIKTELYNPCSKGSRLGILKSDLPKNLPLDIEGLHFHCHCESGSDVFSRTMAHIIDKFSSYFEQVKWVNFGGGHLVTKEDYDIELLVKILKDFKNKFPHLKVILEPGSAFLWQTGDLYSQVVDIVKNNDIKTAILNVSFSCHMPDCLEMPYMPKITNANILLEEESKKDIQEERVYRLGGNSCLSGDYMGQWEFNKTLEVGDIVIFEDMLHYTTVKTNMFNGISHPGIALLKKDGTLEILKEFSFEDFKSRMD